MHRLPPNLPEPNHGRRAIETETRPIDAKDKTSPDQGTASEATVAAGQDTGEGLSATETGALDFFLQAEAYAHEFAPKKGIDYSWVLKNTIDHYNNVEKDFDTVDNKAQSLIAYFGAGTSVLAVGVILAISEHKISHLVGLAFAPSIICGLAAIIMAAYSRRTQVLVCGPTLKGVDQTLAFYLDQKDDNGEDLYTEAEASKMAEYFSIARWDKSAATNGKVVLEKCKMYNRAIKALVVSVVLLITPYLVALLS